MKVTALVAGMVAGADSIDDMALLRHGGMKKGTAVGLVDSNAVRISVLAGRMFIMPKAFPLEFRRDVVAVARKNEAPIARVAKDFGISESCLQRWLKLADIEHGNRPGTTQADAAELREAKKRIRLLEQENEILRRAAAYLSQASLPK